MHKRHSCLQGNCLTGCPQACHQAHGGCGELGAQLVGAELPRVSGAYMHGVGVVVSALAGTALIRVLNVGMYSKKTFTLESNWKRPLLPSACPDAGFLSAPGLPRWFPYTYVYLVPCRTVAAGSCPQGSVWTSGWTCSCRPPPLPRPLAAAAMAGAWLRWWQSWSHLMARRWHGPAAHCCCGRGGALSGKWEGGRGLYGVHMGIQNAVCVQGTRISGQQGVYGWLLLHL